MYDENYYHNSCKSNGELLDESKYPQSLSDIIMLMTKNYKDSCFPIPYGESTQFVLWQVNWDCYEIWIESYELENKFKKISNEVTDK